MELQKFSATISGEKFNIAAFNASLLSTTAKAIRNTHYVLMIDRSGSMSWTINDVIDQVQHTTDHISEQDLITVIWYSGVGQFSTIIKGATKNDVIKKILDSIRGVVGLTCFSDAAAEAAKVIEELSGVVDQSVVILYTDGDPVVPWSNEVEATKVLTSIENMKNFNLASFNCIGYGKYYNRDFLVKLSNASEFGVTIHNSRVTEFLGSFEDTVNTASGLVVQKLSVETGADTEILYLNDTLANLRENELHLTRLNKTKNQIFVVTPTGSKSVITINDEDHTLTGAASTEDSIKEDFFYAYAAQLYYQGKRQKALDVIVNNVRDKFLANKMVNAFTIDEVAETQTALNNAAYGGDRFIEGKTGPGFLPKKDALCVMDVFQKMFESRSSAFYLPFSQVVDSYKRIGRKTEDQYNVFVASKDEVRQSVSDFVWNSEKLNLSLRFEMQGHVELNPREANAVGLPKNYPSKIYRTHTFVKDGNLNIQKAEFIVDEDLLKIFEDLKVPFTHLQESRDTVTMTQYHNIVIDFSKLPVINRTYVDNSDSLDDLHSIVTEITQTEASIKVVNDLLKKIYASSATSMKVGAYADLTAAQMTVLENHGIRKDGVYGGVDNKQAKVGESDFYLTRVMDFSLKGCSSLPSIKDFEAMLSGSKKINLPGSFMVGYYRELATRVDLSKTTNVVRDYLILEQRNLKTTLNSLRQRLNIVKLAKALTNDFFHGLVPDDKGNYTYEKNDNVMVLKTERAKEYIDAA